ncbi:hypothetical protein [Streptomyces sp. B6B3]|uniref:hypothetical protein n=1 Tax=Streptomyces sp. B6B3 TaxID=3153570 RepID=UPI00325D9723
MRYQHPRRITPAEAEDAFRSQDSTRIAETLISSAFHCSEREWVEGWLIRFSGHPEVRVRRAAALALGHLARLHGQVSPEAVAAVSALLDDAELSGAPANALDDVRMFTDATP